MLPTTKTNSKKGTSLDHCLQTLGIVFAIAKLHLAENKEGGGVVG